MRNIFRPRRRRPVVPPAAQVAPAAPTPTAGDWYVQSFPNLSSALSYCDTLGPRVQIRIDAHGLVTGNSPLGVTVGDDMWLNIQNSIENRARDDSAIGFEMACKFTQVDEVVVRWRHQP